MLTLRDAVPDDLPAIVRLFALPEDGNEADANPAEPLDERYAIALAHVTADPNNALVVAEEDGRVVGTFQLTIIQQVAYRGAKVAQLENVIVDPEFRSQGVGEAMMRWAIDVARRRDCYRVQLTSNKRRTRAHAFYERLGFVASHDGFKRVL